MRRGIEHREAFASFGGFAQGHLQHFGQMQRVTVGFLGNLFAAAKSVGDDEPVGRSLAHGGQQFEFANAFEISYFSFSKPNAPAMPQHPGAGAVKSIPMRSSTASSAVIFMIAL